MGKFERLDDEDDFKYENLTPSELARVLATYLRVFAAIYQEYNNMPPGHPNEARNVAILDQAVHHITHPFVTERLYLIGALLEGVGFEVPK